MLRKRSLYILFCVLLAACLGTEHDQFSDSLTYQPSIDLPIIETHFSFSDSSSFPADIPLEGLSISFSDSIDFDLYIDESGVASENIVSLTLNMELVNRFPHPVTLEFYCPLHCGAKLVLGDEPIDIAAAPLGAYGVILEPVSNVYTLVLSAEEFETIYDLGIIRLVAHSDDIVPGSYFWLMLHTYTLSINFGMRIHLTVSNL